MFCHPRDRVTRLAVKRLSLRAVDLQKFHRVGFLVFHQITRQQRVVTTPEIAN